LFPFYFSWCCQGCAWFAAVRTANRNLRSAIPGFRAAAWWLRGAQHRAICDPQEMVMGHLLHVGQNPVYGTAIQRIMVQARAKHVPRISTLEQKYVPRPEVLD
jgi:hypothetical protein